MPWSARTHTGTNSCSQTNIRILTFEISPKCSQYKHTYVCTHVQEHADFNQCVSTNVHDIVHTINANKYYKMDPLERQNAPKT